MSRCDAQCEFLERWAEYLQLILQAAKAIWVAPHLNAVDQATDYRAADPTLSMCQPKLIRDQRFCMLRAGPKVLRECRFANFSFAENPQRCDLSMFAR